MSTREPGSSGDGMRMDRRNLLRGLGGASILGTVSLAGIEGEAGDTGDADLSRGTEWLTNAYRLRKSVTDDGEGEFERVVGNVILSHLSADTRAADGDGIDPRRRLAATVLEGGLREGSVAAALSTRGDAGGEDGGGGDPGRR